MAKFGPRSINPGTGRLIQNRGKGGGEEVLPSRHAMAQVTRGSDPWQRSIGNYAKLTPNGANAPTYQDITDMAEMGASVKPK